MWIGYIMNHYQVRSISLLPSLNVIHGDINFKTSKLFAMLNLKNCSNHFFLLPLQRCYSHVSHEMSLGNIIFDFFNTSARGQEKSFGCGIS